MKECKRHKWRVGSKQATLIGGKLITFIQNIWCERCDKRIKANIYSDFELEQMKEKAQSHANITHKGDEE